MKRSVLILIVLVSFLAASCASYTCPTYSKAPQEKGVKESRI